MPDAKLTERPELVGVAGYVTPYPYLELLQEKMEERLDQKVPAAGRFCGFCYGRLREADMVCGFCARDTAAYATAGEIPQEVLKAYKTKQKTEATWVHLGAFFGLIIASVLFVWLEVWGPGPLGHPATGFAVLIGGGYLLAQLFGPLIGGQFGYAAGARKRDGAWAAFLAKREGAG